MVAADLVSTGQRIVCRFLHTCKFPCFKINLESEGFSGKVMQTQAFAVVFQSTSVTNTCIIMVVNVGSKGADHYHFSVWCAGKSWWKLQNFINGDFETGLMRS